MRTFQIRQNFGKGSLGFEYFDMPIYADIEDIKIKATEVQNEDYKNRHTGFLGIKALENKKIKVQEYCKIKHKCVKGGISFYVNWK